MSSPLHTSVSVVICLEEAMSEMLCKESEEQRSVLGIGDEFCSLEKSFC